MADDPTTLITYRPIPGHPDNVQNAFNHFADACRDLLLEHPPEAPTVTACRDCPDPGAATCFNGLDHLLYTETNKAVIEEYGDKVNALDAVTAVKTAAGRFPERIDLSAEEVRMALAGVPLASIRYLRTPPEPATTVTVGNLDTIVGFDQGRHSYWRHHLVIDPDTRVVSAAARGDNGRRDALHTEQVLSLGIVPNNLTPDGQQLVAQWIREHADDLNDLAAGHTVEWDGHNSVGVYDPEQRETLMFAFEEFVADELGESVYQNIWEDPAPSAEDALDAGGPEAYATAEVARLQDDGWWVFEGDCMARATEVVRQHEQTVADARPMVRRRQPARDQGMAL